MSIFTVADKAVYTRLESMISGYYGELLECSVTIGILFAHPSSKSPDKPAIMVHGIQVYSTIRLINLKDRVAGLPDVQLILDGPYWSDRTTTEANRTEIIDSQLYRLEVKRDKSGGIITDDLGRPVFRLKRPDYALSGYDAIIRRHGAGSLAMQAVDDVSLRLHTLVPTADVRETADVN